MGSEAVLTLMTNKLGSKPSVIAINGNQTVCVPLEEAVSQTQLVTKALDKNMLDKVVELRGPCFSRYLEIYLKMSKLEPKCLSTTSSNYVLGIMSVGAPASGVNSAVRSFVRHGVSNGCCILGIVDGFEGLVSNQVKQLDWKSVFGWTSQGGSLLGSQRVDAKRVGFAKIAEKFRQLKLDGLAIIGGFEAFTSVLQLKEQRHLHNEFCIPLVCIPATISNNVPGTDYSIGCDTALNEIVAVCFTLLLIINRNWKKKKEAIHHIIFDLVV